MRPDLLPATPETRKARFVEESGEVTIALGQALKALGKIDRFGAIATDPRTGISYDNVADLRFTLQALGSAIDDARSKMQEMVGELDDLRHAVTAMLTIDLQPADLQPAVTIHAAHTIPALPLDLYGVEAGWMMCRIAASPGILRADVLQDPRLVDPISDLEQNLTLMIEHDLVQTKDDGLVLTDKGHEFLSVLGQGQPSTAALVVIDEDAMRTVASGNGGTAPAEEGDPTLAACAGVLHSLAERDEDVSDVLPDCHPQSRFQTASSQENAP